MNRRGVFGLALAALLVEASPAQIALSAEPSGAANGVDLSCFGRLAFGRMFLSSEAQQSLEFEVSLRFGEGEILALIDPETSKVDTILYDAEVTSGSLRFKGENERRVIWTRLSGVMGPLVGEAVDSDGDIVALSIERRAPDGGGRPFALFDASGGSAYRGVCRQRRGPD
ncbi:MAG TPA: hypothetical protein VFE63_12265 [Roseiarcus sp.]|jgi:hypothetical protein|nr:hypothetical protein [Roseiarcus sp.]